MNANTATSTPVRKTRILVADDHPLFREGLASVINRQDDLLCCGEADSASCALKALRELCPEVLLLDLRLQNEDGIALIETIKAEFPELRILVISQCEEALYSERALRAGAHGYVLKEETADEVLAAIRCVLTGDLFVSRRVVGTVLRSFLNSKSHNAPRGIDALSSRELQLFGMLGDGMSTRHIADHLQLSLKTVETHREHIKHKLGLPSGTALVREAIRWRHGRSNLIGKAPDSLPAPVSQTARVDGCVPRGFPGYEAAS
jgi:DNA-binding NarL/FixJ family response regulator